MSEEALKDQEVNGELELVYVHMPQNDKQQIEQVVKEYESDCYLNFKTGHFKAEKWTPNGRPK